MSRFALQWLVPAGADRFTHVMLLDKDRPAPYVSEAGHRADKVHALLSLWETLIERGQLTISMTEYPTAAAGLGD
jgi:hypothetical protein